MVLVGVLSALTLWGTGAVLLALLIGDLARSREEEPGPEPADRTESRR